MGTVGIVWLKRDLRVADHAPLPARPRPPPSPR